MKQRSEYFGHKRRAQPRPDRSANQRSGFGDDAEYTEMEQQVLELRRQHGDMLLLFECGYRFRIFGEDARVTILRGIAVVYQISQPSCLLMISRISLLFR